MCSENDSWQCMLCTNINDYAAIITARKDDKPAGGGLSEHERKIAERMLLELYCQYDPSLAFRDVVNPEVRIFLNSSHNQYIIQRDRNQLFVLVFVFFCLQLLYHWFPLFLLFILLFTTVVSVRLLLVTFNK